MFRGKRSGDFEHVFLFQELVDVEYWLGDDDDDDENLSLCSG